MLKVRMLTLKKATYRTNVKILSDVHSIARNVLEVVSIFHVPVSIPQLKMAKLDRLCGH